MKNLLIFKIDLLKYERYNYLFIDFIILYVLVGLKNIDKITEAKFKGQLKALRNGTLQKLKNTYKCDLNDTWYNGEKPMVMFIEILEDSAIKAVNAEDMVQAIMFWKGCGYNHAINIFASLYFKPFLNSWHPEHKFDSLATSFGVRLPFDTTVRFINDSFCGCCGSRKSSVEPRAKNDLSELICDYLHNFKKGNLSKIPKYNDLKMDFYF